MTVQAAAIVDLIGKGFVEPTIPPTCLPHLFVQQVIGLILQEHGLTRSGLQDWLGRLTPIAGTGEEERILKHMLAEGILMQDQGVLGMGVAGERRYGKRHYMEVLSVFTSPPGFTAWHGRHEIGNVDVSALNLRSGEPTILLLAGKTWQVDSVNWSKRILTVTPVQASGKSRWTGQPAALGAELCAAIRDVLLGTETHPSWSRRAQENIQQSREAHDFLSRGPLTLQARNDSTRLWTFAGRRCNAALAFAALAEGRAAVPNNLFLDINGTISVDFLAVLASRLTRPESFVLDTLEGLDLPDIKFSDALPSPLRTRLHMERALDVPCALATLTKPRPFPHE
jgi:ATP-dependent Lhr-like helicase